MFLKVKHCENKQHVKFMEIFKKSNIYERLYSLLLRISILFICSLLILFKCLENLQSMHI